MEALYEKMQAELNDSNNEKPFIVVDLQEVVSRYTLWSTELPMITPHYVVKCNTDLSILKVLKDAGCSFDCASRKEMEPLFNLGLDSSRIVYANTYKTKTDIIYAAKKGVHLMTVDTEGELHKIKELDPDAEILIRIIPWEPNNEDADLSKRFGCDVSTADVLLQKCLDLGLNVIGVSFHVGCNCRQVDLWSKSIELAKQVFDMAKQRGVEMSCLNIGGGFPSDPVFFKELAADIRGTLSRLFPPERGVRFISEPGRFLVKSSSTLFSTIIGKRTCDKLVSYVLDVGLHNLFAIHQFNPLEEENHKPTILKRGIDSKQLHPSVLYGPTCDIADRIFREPVLLPHLEIGDHMVFENVGAYTISLASLFNGIELPTVLYTQNVSK